MTWGISNYSTTPGSNTAINGINIAPGCPASSVGPALRQMMADIAAALAGGQFVPTGQINWFPTATAPAGYLALTSSTPVSRTSYPALFSLLGTTFGAGDGSTTFGLPLLAGRSVAGYDPSNATGLLTGLTGGVSAATIGNTGGEQAHTLAATELPAHTHNYSGSAITGSENQSHNHNLPPVVASGSGGSVGGSGVITNSGTTGPTGIENQNHNHNFSWSGTTDGGTGGGGAHNTVQPTIILLPCIKT